MPPWNVLAEAPIPGAAIKTQVARVNVKVENNHFFKGAQQCVTALPVLSVWGATSTSMPSALLPNCGMGGTYGCAESNRGGLSLWMASSSVSVSKPWPDAQRPLSGTYYLYDKS